MDKRLTDKEAKRLLRRASELDAEEAQKLDLATFREIAAEAGISPAAVDAALREDVSTQEPAPVQRSSGRRVLTAFGVVGILFIALIFFAFVARAFP